MAYFNTLSSKNERQYWGKLENRMGGSNQDLNHHLQVH
jgi:hypothetical protein